MAKKQTMSKINSSHYKQQIKRQGKRCRCFDVGEPCKNIYIYKYVSFEVLKQMVGLRFNEPSAWNDEYERLFYQADYDSKLMAKSETHPRLFACCLTQSQYCEPSWRMYCKRDPKAFCIQLRINRKAFYDALNDYGKNHGWCFYFGKVNYELNNHHISVLHQPQFNSNGRLQNTTGHAELFRDFTLDSFLSLLLIKRQAFCYEDELRIFAIPDDGKSIDSKPDVKNCNSLDHSLCLDIPLNWSMVTQAIIDVKAPDEDRQEAMRILKEKGIEQVSEYNINSCATSSQLPIVIAPSI